MVCDMSAAEHRKLVRDRVPQLIRSRGDEPTTRTLDSQEFLDALLAKLVEEARELQDAPMSERLPELADVWEVLLTLVEQLGFTPDDVALAAQMTRTVRGGFAERVWLESTTTGADSASSAAGAAASGGRTEAPARAFVG